MSFHPKNNYILENDIVKLRPLVMEDMEHLLPFSMKEPELWTYSLLPGNGYDNLKVYFERALKDRELGFSLPFIVFDKRTNEYAGTTRFYDIQNHHSTTQLGFTWYGNKFHKTGLNRNCKLLMLNFAFDTIKVKRVEFRADANNAPSIAAMKSLGCVEEGILRSNCDSPHGRRDSIVLSILESEWRNGVKTKLQDML